MTALAAEFTKQLGSLSLETSLTAAAGTTTVLVGESGAGKTTILNVLAGLIHPDRGTIRVGQAAYFSSDLGIAVPAEARSIGYVFQDYALFPHLSAFENVAFGLRAQGIGGAAVRARARETLKQLGILDLAEHRPTALSGGQQQRVALARALVLEPQLLLLDEPLSALDLRTRTEIRAELRRVLQALPCITLFVTHSPVEAMVFGDAIAVVEHGRISQAGERSELLRQPRSRYVAELMGLNFFQGRVTSRDAHGLANVQAGDGTLRIVDAGPEAEVYVAVDPRDITLHLAPPTGTAQNVFRGRIAQVVPELPYGERVRVLLRTRPPLVAEVTAHALHALALREGLEVYAAFKATAAKAYP